MDFLTQSEINSARLALGLARSHLQQAERMAALHHQDTLPISNALSHLDCAEHLLDTVGARSTRAPLVQLSEPTNPTKNNE